MAQTVKVQMQFNANTEQAKQQIVNLQNQLNQLANGSNLAQLGNKLSTSMADAMNSVKQLGSALETSLNVDTGKLNLTKFQTELQRTGKNFQEYGKLLNSMGPQGQQAFQQLTHAVMNANTKFTISNKLVTSLWTNLKNVAKWQISSAVLTAFTKTFSDAFSYAKDLNESLNNIRIVSGQSAEQMARFAKEANKAAKALSTTTTEYTDASLIFYQQGLEGKAVTDRADVVIKMANVTGDAAKEVSDQMTAVWNNFYDGTKTLEYYADGMTALGAATASSTDEIATGLEKFAGIAGTVGLSYEYATAALATVTATTRQSADVVGTAFKTLFARIQDLELGETLDDGTTLGKYSEALSTIGVNIKDTNGGLKDMDDILDETAEKWGTIDRATKTAVAQTVAGTRQYTQFMTLMENWDFMEENLNTVNNATGTLQEQAETYEESWTAATKRVKASAEGIYDSLINDEFIIDLTDGFGEFLSFIEKLVDSMGGFKGVLSGLSILMFKLFGDRMAAGIAKMTQSLYSMTGAAQRVNMSFKEQVLTTAIESLPSGGYGEGAIQSQIFKDQLMAERNMAKQYGDKMTPELERALAIHKDILQLLGEEVIKAQTEAQVTQDATEALEQQIALLEKKKAKYQNSYNTNTGNEYLDEYNQTFKSLNNNSAGIQFKESDLKIKGKENAEAYSARILKNYNLEGQAAQELKKRLEDLYAAKKLITESGDKEAKAANNIIKQRQQESHVTEELNKKLKEKEAQDKRNEKAKRNLTKAEEDYAKAANSNPPIPKPDKYQQFASGLMKTSSAAMTLSMGFNSLKSAIDTIKDPDMSGWEKITSVLMSVSMALPMVIMLMNNGRKAISMFTTEEGKNTLATTLNTAAKWLNAKATDKAGKEAIETAGQKTTETVATEANTKAETKNTLVKATKGKDGQMYYFQGGKRIGAKEGAKLLEAQKSGTAGVSTGGTGLAAAWKGFGAALAKIAPMLGWIAGIIAVIVATSVILYKTWQRNDIGQQLKKANEEAQQTKKILGQVNEMANKINETVSNYDSLQEKLKGLTKGTQEWRQALLETNQAAIDLQNTYPDIIKLERGANGELAVTQQSLQELQNWKLQQQASAAAANFAAQNKVTRLDFEQKEEEAYKKIRDIYSDLPIASNNSVADIKRTDRKNDGDIWFDGYDSSEFINQFANKTKEEIAAHINANLTGGQSIEANDNLIHEIQDVANTLALEQEKQTAQLKIKYEEIGHQIKLNVPEGEDIPEGGEGLVGQVYQTYYDKNVGKTFFGNAKDEEIDQELDDADWNRAGAVDKVSEYLKQAGYDISTGSVIVSDAGNGKNNITYKDSEGNKQTITEEEYYNIRAGQKASEKTQEYMNTTEYQKAVRGGYADAIFDASLSENGDLGSDIYANQKLYDKAKSLGFFEKGANIDWALKELGMSPEMIEQMSKEQKLNFRQNLSDFNIEDAKKQKLTNLGLNDVLVNDEELQEQFMNMPNEIFEAVKASGKITKDTTKEELAEIIKETEKQAEASNRISFFQQLDQIETDFNVLGEAMDELSDKGYLTGKTLSGLQSSFGTLNGFNDFINVMTESTSTMEEKETALENLASEYLIEQNRLGQLTPMLREETIARLEGLGVKNAEAVVDAQLNKNLIELIIKHGNNTEALMTEASALGYSKEQTDALSKANGILEGTIDGTLEDLIAEGTISRYTAQQLAIAKLATLDLNVATDAFSAYNICKQLSGISGSAKESLAWMTALTNLLNSEFFSIDKDTGALTMKTLADYNGDIDAYYEAAKKAGFYDFMRDGEIDINKAMKNRVQETIDEFNTITIDTKINLSNLDIGNTDDKNDGNLGEAKETERFIELNNQLEENNRLREINNKLKKQNPNDLTYIDKDIKLLQDERDILEKLKKEANDYMWSDKQFIQNNYGDLLEAITGSRELRISEIKDGGDGTTLLDEELITTEVNKLFEGADENRQEYLQGLLDYIASYNEAAEKYYDADGKLYDNLESLGEATLERTSSLFGKSREITKGMIEDSEFRSELFDDDLEGMAGVTKELMKQAALTASTQQSINDQMWETTHQFELNQMTPEQYVEAMKALKEEAQDSAKALKDVKEEMFKIYGEALDKGIEDISFYTDLFDNLTGSLEHYKNITELLGTTRETAPYIKKILEGTKTVTWDNFEAAGKTYSMLNDEYIRIQNQLKTATGTEKEMLEQQLKDLTPELADAYDNWLSLGEDYADTLEEILTHTIETLAQEMEDLFTSTETGFDLLNARMENLQSKDEVYLTKTNQEYETQKMLRTAQAAIDASTNKAHQRLLKQFQDETKQLQNQENLSKSQLELQQLKYDLLVAQIALEDARDAKNKVRLMRDSQGNFNYVYTADQDAITEAQQKVDDASNALYNKGIEVYNSSTQNYIKALEEYNDLYESTDFNDPQQVAKLEEARLNTIDKLTWYSQEANDAAKDLTDAGYDISDAWAASMWDTVASVETFKNDSEYYLEEAKGAVEDYQLDIDKMSQATGITLGTTTKNVNDLTTASQTLGDKAGTAIINTQNALNTIASDLDTWATTVGKDIDIIIGKLLGLIGTANTAINTTKGFDENGNKLPPKEKTPDVVEEIIEPTTTTEETKPVEIETETVEIETPKTYTVKSGDNLSKIAKEVYGDASKWNELYEKNKAIIGNNPSKIYPGQILQYNTGGYTGKWGPEGRLAMLHEKELVLNKDDTANFLDALELTRSVLQAVDLNTIASQYSLTGKMAAATFADAFAPIQQDVHITAEFPNATDKEEIKAAFDDIINEAVQYAGIKRV